MKPQRFFLRTILLCLGLATAVAGQVRIMPLGNSLTDGDGSSNGGGYRFHLYNALTNANIDFDFVGALQGGTGFADTDHEGHGGFRADQLDVQTYLTNNPADAVFLEIGTNDISFGESAAQVKTDIEAVVDAIHNFDAKIEIYLGTLIPRKDDNARQAVTDALNALLPGLVSAKSSAGYRIFLVDHAARFKANPNWKTELMSDDLHPNDAGYGLMAQEWFTSYVTNTGSNVTQFADDFNSGVLSTAWAAHPAYKVQSGELRNTSSTDAFDLFIAAPTVITNANVLEFKFGTQSDFIGRAYTGAALMLDAAATTANGYLIFHNSEFKKVRLYTVENGIPKVKVDEADTQAPDPDAGDTFRVEWNTDNDGHHFCVYINGVRDACLNDANKLQGNVAKLYAGVMINGNSNNAIDDFYTAKVTDSTPPAAVTDLKVKEVAALAMTLEWTAPGDDGNTGTARSYTLRYSTSPISANNFNNATLAPNLPPPAPAGTRQSFTIGGLNSGTTYYFALKTTDEFGNVSALSNVASAATPTLNLFTDNFNRSGPELGSQWSTTPDMKIVKGTVQNKAAADIWSAAIYTGVRNPLMVSFRWGPQATTYGTNWCGLLVMANSTNPATVDGYMVQRYPEGGKTRLWRVSNGRFAGIVDEGNSFAPAPKAGSEMKVVMRSDASGHHFEVYINDVFDRSLSDKQKLTGNAGTLYAGFYIESTLDSLNAIDSFTAGVLPAAPGVLVKQSGDNQTKPVGQQLPQPLVVTLLDKLGNPMPGQIVNFVVTAGSATVNNPPAADEHIRLEAEHAQITSPIETRNDPEAANGKYIVYPVGRNEDASATFKFTITRAGDYRVWTRSAKTGSQPGSWFISIDGKADFVYDVFQGTTNGSWTWDLVSERGNGGPATPQFDPKIITLAAGTHTIEFKARWEDTKLDKILITNDSSYIPNGKEEVGYLTDASGIASAKVTLGATIGKVQINAVHGNLPPAIFTATATVGAPDSLVLVSGAGQSGPAGKVLSQPLKVKVTDSFGNPVANQQVSWMVSEGNGQLENYVSTSDTNGMATTNFTPGNRSTVNKVLALATYANKAVEFSATTSSGIADAMNVVAGNNQTATVGTKLSAPLVVKMADASNKAVANYPVDVTVTRGGGSLSPSNPVRNGGFETASSNLPANWNLESNPTASEVALSNDAASGAKSLQVNSTRGGVGVSQILALAANTNYTFSFWIKVKRGTARVTLRTNDADGNLREKEIDINLASAWQRYMIIAPNGAAGTRQLFFKTNGSAEFLVDEVKVLPNTNSDGLLNLTWTLGDTAMAQKVVVNDGAVIDSRGTLKGFPFTFAAIAKAGAPKTLAAVSGDGQIGSAGQPLRAPFAVKVTDNFGNGIEKINVTFTAAVGNGNFNGQQALVVPTDSTGSAKAVLTMGPTPGATNTAVATAQGLPGVSVTFNAIAAIPSQAQKVAGATQGSAGYPVNTPLTVRVTDNSGNRIGGFPVVFTVQEGGGKIDNQTTATIVTDIDGEAKAFLVLGPNPGAQNKVLATATSNGQPLQGSGINFTVTAAKLKDLLLASGNEQIGIAGEPLPKALRAKIQDELGKGIKGQNVTFTVVSGGGKLSGNVNTRTIPTDSLGIAAATLTLGPRPGQNNNQVRAETNPALNGSPLLFVASAKVGPPAVLKEISGDSLSGVAGNPLPAPFVTQVTDKNGNALPDIPVIFTVKSGGGSFNGVTKDTVKSDVNGYAQITLTAGNTVGRYNNVVEARAFNGSLELANSPMIFVASSTLSNARVISLQSGNRQFGKAGAPLANPLVVKVVDRSNNVVATHPVNFRVVRGGGVFANGKPDTTVNTNASGLARAVLTLGGLVQPDSQIVFASSNDGVDQLQNSPIGFVAYASPGSPSGATSYVEATSPVPADGVSQTNIKVFVRDPFGNAVSNVAVTIQISGESQTFPTANTDAQGKAEFKFATTRAGRKTVSLKINGAIVGRSASVLFTPLAAAQINMVSGQAQTGNVNTALPKTLAVNVLDKFNNGVPNHPVDFVIEAGNGRLLRQSPILTDSTGVASVTYVLGPTPGENRIRAASSGLANSPITFVATATNASAANLEYVSGNNQQATAGQILSQPLVVKVTDANKRAVYGMAVNFAVNFGGGNVDGRSSVTVRTDEYGEARVTWQLGATAGVNTVRAAVAGLTGSPIDFQAIAVSGTATTLAAFSGDGASGQVNQELATPLTARVTDANGNGADGVHVFFELIQGSGTLSGGVGNATTRDVTTTNGGFAATKIIFGPEIGPRKIRVTALNANGASLRGSPLTFTVYGRAGAVKSIAAVSRTNNQRGTANKPLNFPLQVIAYDERGNPVEGAQINFSVTQNTGYFPGGALNALVLTNSKGVAAIEWTIKGGTNKAQASAVGLSTPPVTFDATGVTDNNFPVFTKIPPQQKREGERIEFVVSAIDADNDPVRYGAKNLPLGAVFDSLGTRIFTWQTDQNSAGQYEVSFLAFDSRGGVDEEVVTIDVINRNQAPVITGRIPVGNHPGKPDTTVLQPGTPLRMKVLAKDPDGDALSYRWYVNGKFAGSVFDTFDFRGELAWNTVEARVFDQEDTVRTVWSIKVPVELASFTAQTGDGPGVKLNWKTGSEINNAGFNILRSRSQAGIYAKLNDKLIPANREGSYSFIDATAEAGARYYYKLEALDTRGNITTHGPIVVDVAAPATFELSQNYPNPFNPTTQIRYQLPQAVQVSLTIYNMLGQEVRKLVNAQQPAGYHTAMWDGRDNAGRLVPTGVYHYRIQAGSFTMTKRMLMAK
ncbi:MAG: Ig-like domain-containing protein [candidate division KSB1 bacterium]|nr:Ig-like domain-containing protein [candidate division KSB1 bacterium]MDZ7367993.1 Ig-like domain-containing protein [candidate division KSB1 bacterium]MDZ7405616.1 Ig-like domain-containing protein [candidate division KSB1 bacterium]